MFISSNGWNHRTTKRRILRGVIAKVLNCSLDVGEFGLQSDYCDHFRSNALRTPMNTPIPPVVYLKVSLLLFYKEGFGIK